jgi:hypothetical protein
MRPKRQSKRVKILQYSSDDDNSEDSPYKNTSSEEEIEEIQGSTHNFSNSLNIQVENELQELPIEIIKKPKKPKTEKVDFDSIHPDLKEIWDNLEKQPHFEASCIDQPDGLIMIDLG